MLISMQEAYRISIISTLNREQDNAIVINGVPGGKEVIVGAQKDGKVVVKKLPLMGLTPTTMPNFEDLLHSGVVMETTEKLYEYTGI